MKVNISREAAQALVDRLDGLDVGNSDLAQELEAFRGRLATRLDQSAVVQKLTAGELLTVIDHCDQLPVHRGTEYCQLLVAARAKLKVLLELTTKEPDDDRD